MIRPCIVESPFNLSSHSRADLVRYAQLCCMAAMQMGLAPFASHLCYTHFMGEDSETRALGLSMRDAIAVPLLRAGGCVIRFTDFGITPGMVRQCDQGFDAIEQVLPAILMDHWRSGIAIQGSLALRPAGA